VHPQVARAKLRDGAAIANKKLELNSKARVRDD
jgi:hypothetical protein